MHSSKLFHPVYQRHSFFKKQYLTNEEGDEFYHWQKMGFYCFLFGFNKKMTRRCFTKQVELNKINDKITKMWHIRAFLYGCKGIIDGYESPLIQKNEWPEKPDNSWEDVVCFYPDETFELDFLHPVSCCFWNDDNPRIKNPFVDNNISIDYNLLVELGFDVMYMNMLEAKVSYEKSEPHLQLVSNT